MLKYLFYSLFVFCGHAHAHAHADAAGASFTLENPAILGRYVLSPPNKLSSIQSAEVRFDADSALNLFISHTGDSHLLEQMDKDEVIVGGEPDPNCADCHSDETEGQGDRTRIRLVKGNQGRPRLLIEVTWGDTLDKEGKNGETVTYVLDWAQTIPNAISFYLNIDNPAPLQATIDSCSAAVTPAVSDNGPIFSDSDVCPAISSVKYRTTVEEALPWYLKEMGIAKGTKEISITLAKNALNKEEFYFAKLPAKGLKVKPDKIAAAFKKVSEHLQKTSDRVFAREDDGSVTYYMINTKDQVISNFSLQTR